MTTVNAIKCNKCGDIIYSRTRHDFHWCSCNNIAIDGGRDYTKITFKEKEPPKIFQLEINATSKELADDWNNEIDKFGTIKQGDKPC